MKREVFLSLVLAAAPLYAFAHGDGHANKKATAKPAGPVEATPFGQAGDPTQVTRTVRVEMSDRMRFVPDAITVRRGETVKFVVRNSGKALHEMVLGTMDHLNEHYELMKKFPSMEHDEPHQAHVDPGRQGEIVWQFTNAGEFYYGCLIPGHFEAGMIGKVTVR
ncbi:MAG: cupredoxin family protein [Burkholderiales bacterium]|nr:cupredoxin family protein [Burkholderiales bacterium]